LISGTICDGTFTAALSVNSTTCKTFGPNGGTCASSSIHSSTVSGAVNLQIPSFLLFAVALLVKLLLH